MKIFIVQPVFKVDESEIIATRERAIKAILNMGHESAVCEDTEDVGKYSKFVTNAIKHYDAVYFCKGCEDDILYPLYEQIALLNNKQIITEGQEAQFLSMRNYIGVISVKAEPQKNDGVAGYRVFFNNGNQETWWPKDIFERTFFPVQEPNALSLKDIDAFIGAGCKETKKLGKEVIMVRVEFPTGWEEFEHSKYIKSCITSEELGAEVAESTCMSKIRTKLWEYLSFVMQWANNGLSKKQ